MVQALTNPVSFDEFLEWYPDQADRRYELHRGVIVEMPKPKGKHSEVAGFVNGQLYLEITRLGLPYVIPKESIIKAPDGFSGYEPDGVVLARDNLPNEPLWEKASTITMGTSVKVIIEVVSTNWQDDYLLKLGDYERLGIQEYWIIDYLGLGGRLFIGYPKRPTLSIYRLMDGEYDVERFTGDDPIVSPTFPELSLTAARFFAATL
jgi:Uma2 family endonuclease